MTLLLWQFIWLPLILAALYPIAVQYERGVRWVIPITAFALVLDAYLNWTTMCVYFWEMPRKRIGETKTEYTISDRLKRLKHDSGWRGNAARYLGRYLNFFSPGHI